MKKLKYILSGMGLIMSLLIFGQAPSVPTELQEISYGIYKPSTIPEMRERQVLETLIANTKYLDAEISSGSSIATNMGSDSTTIDVIDGATYEISWYNGDTIPTYIPEAYRDDGSLTIDVQTGTTYTLDADDINGPVIYMESASANTLSLPTVATSGWSIGNYLTVTMWGAGTTSIDPAVGVNINGSNDDVDISAQYGMVQIIMVTTNEWHIIGTK